MKKYIIAIFYLSINAECLFGQTISIDWVEIRKNKVVINYSLEDSNPNHQYLVTLFASKDNFSTPLTKVSGDVGEDINPGREKRIEWDIINELGQYKGNLSFELRGRVFIPFVKFSEFEEGSTYKSGKNYPIIWTSGNLSGQVNIELFQEKERIWGENNVPNIGRYDWFVPTTIKKGTDYRLKFTNAKDRNDITFSPVFNIKRKVPFVAKIGVLAALGAGVLIIPKKAGPTEETPLPGNPGKPD